MLDAATRFDYFMPLLATARCCYADSIITKALLPDATLGDTGILAGGIARQNAYAATILR